MTLLWRYSIKQKAVSDGKISQYITYYKKLWLMYHEDKKKDHEKILEEIIVENFPKMGKEIITQVQETQRVPNRINPR